jgi:hypothetical protein
LCIATLSAGSVTAGSCTFTVTGHIEMVNSGGAIL